MKRSDLLPRDDNSVGGCAVFNPQFVFSKRECGGLAGNTIAIYLEVDATRFSAQEDPIATFIEVAFSNCELDRVPVFVFT